MIPYYLLSIASGYKVLLWHNLTCAIKHFIRHWLYKKLYCLPFTSLGNRCTAPFVFFTVQSRSGTPLLSAHRESPPLFLWPIPRSRFMSLLVPTWHLEIRRHHRELRLASTVCNKRHGWCTLPRSLSQMKRNDFRIRQVKDTETILPHSLASFSYHFTKGSLNPQRDKVDWKSVHLINYFFTFASIIYEQCGPG